MENIVSIAIMSFVLQQSIKGKDDSNLCTLPHHSIPQLPQKLETVDSIQISVLDFHYGSDIMKSISLVYDTCKKKPIFATQI